MNLVKSIFTGREPVLYTALARQAIVLGAAFGFELTTEQTAAVMGTVEVLVWLFLRQKVSPSRGSKVAKTTLAALALLLAVGCSPAQLQAAANYANAGSRLLDVGAQIVRAVASAKDSGDDPRKAAVDEAIANSGRLVSDGILLAASDEPGKITKARKSLLRAITTLQSVEPFLPDDAKRLLKQAESAMVGIMVDDLGRVYTLGDK